MKIRFILMLCLLMAFFTGAGAGKVCAQQSDPEPMRFYTGKMAELSIERAVYSKEGSDRFFFHFSLRNLGQKTLGLDLSGYYGLFYPNQWMASDTTVRTMIDESRMVFTPAGESVKQELIRDFKAGGLTLVKPAATVDWYISFNASKISDLPVSGRYCIVVFDGRMLITDGENMEEWYYGMETYQERELLLTIPFPKSRIPADAKYIIDNP